MFVTVLHELHECLPGRASLGSPWTHAKGVKAVVQVQRRMVTWWPVVDRTAAYAWTNAGPATLARSTHALLQVRSAPHRLLLRYRRAPLTESLLAGSLGLTDPRH